MSLVPFRSGALENHANPSLSREVPHVPLPRHTSQVSLLLYKNTLLVLLLYSGTCGTSLDKPASNNPNADHQAPSTRYTRGTRGTSAENAAHTP